MMQTTAFVAINHNSRKPYMMTWSVRPQANQVRNAVADNWPRRADGNKSTWQDIRRHGISISKVKIVAI